MLSVPEIAQRTKPVFQKYQVAAAILFGSFAKERASEDSDVDLYVIKGQGSKLTGLFSLASFEDELRRALGREVDVITSIPERLSSRLFRQEIADSGVCIYGSV